MFNKITIYLLLVVRLRKLNVIRVTKKCLLVVILVTNLWVTHFHEIRYQRFRITQLTFILVLFWSYLLRSYTYIYYSCNLSVTHSKRRSLEHLFLPESKYLDAFCWNHHIPLRVRGLRILVVFEMLCCRESISSTRWRHSGEDWDQDDTCNIKVVSQLLLY